MTHNIIAAEVICTLLDSVLHQHTTEFPVALRLLHINFSQRYKGNFLLRYLEPTQFFAFYLRFDESLNYHSERICSQTCLHRVYHSFPCSQGIRYTYLQVIV